MTYRPKLSALIISAWWRLAVALGVSALLWVAIVWALSFSAP